MGSTLLIYVTALVVFAIAGAAVLLSSMTDGARTLRLRARGVAGRNVRVRRRRPTVVDYDVPVRASGTSVVAIDPGAVQVGPDGVPAPLVALTAIEVEPGPAATDTSDRRGSP